MGMIGIYVYVATAAKRETECMTGMAAFAVIVARKEIRTMTGMVVNAAAAGKGVTKGINGPPCYASGVVAQDIWALL